MFRWKDPHNRDWLVDATPECITLQSEGVHLQLHRDQWQRDLSIQEIQQGVILRFSGPDYEVGFLLTKEAAKQFFDLIQYNIASQPIIDVTVYDQPHGIAPPSEHPRVTVLSILAVLLGAFSFFPGAGVLLGLGSIGCAVRVLAKTPNKPSYSHARKMSIVGIVFALAGITTSLLALYCLNQQNWPSAMSVQHLLAGPNPDKSISFYVLVFGIVLMSLSFHECGHAISALWLGDNYAQSQGRCTLNPIAHIDLFGTIILPLLLASMGGPIFGYAKPVPVRTQLMPDPHRAGMLTAISGPGANILLAALAYTLLILIGCLLHLLAPGADANYYSSLGPWVEISGIPGGAPLSGIVQILKLTILINLGLAFFNLLPIPPLDGHWIITGLFPNSIGKLFEAIRPYSFLILIGLMYTGALSFFFIPLGELMYYASILVAACTGS